jgi:hypothetical protein
VQRLIRGSARRALNPVSFEVSPPSRHGHRHPFHRWIRQHEPPEFLNGDLEHGAIGHGPYVAVRGSSVSSDISPKNCPARSRATSRFLLPSNFERPGACAPGRCRGEIYDFW